MDVEGWTHDPTSARRLANVCIHPQARLVSVIKRRTRRPSNAPTVLLQGRVAPEVRAEVQAAAEASGVSIAYYLEALLWGIVREQGTLPTVLAPPPQREEPSIPAA